ncbi:hypothetical protein [Actinomadura physcomitrii]|uniref:hypothetical protein n=1 Tax=Actinomadura physcomitrii TaxID=2650748 RepID=UPI0019218411|nr:hypothetical protein [Actinomadura physcomitrii]
MADWTLLFTTLTGRESAGIPPTTSARGGSAPLNGITVALTDRADGHTLAPDVASGLRTACDALSDLGAQVRKPRAHRPAKPKLAGSATASP